MWTSDGDELKIRGADLLIIIDVVELFIAQALSAEYKLVHGLIAKGCTHHSIDDAYDIAAIFRNFPTLFHIAMLLNCMKSNVDKF